MALETIVLTTGCGEVEEVISNGTNGYIVPIRSPNSIAESIMEIQRLSEDKKSEIKREAFQTLMHQNKVNIY